MGQENPTEVIKDQNYNVDISEFADSLFIDEQPKETPKPTETPKDGDKPDDSKATTPKPDGSKEVIKPDAGKAGDEKPETVTIDGKDYEVSKILESFKDTKNKKEWQSKNTQEAQRIAEMRKVAEPIYNLYKKLSEDGDTYAEIKETITDMLGEEAGEMLDAVKQFDPENFKHPDVEAITKTLAEKEAELTEKDTFLKHYEEKDALKKEYGIREEKAQRVIDKAVELFKETGEAKPLDEVYKIHFLIPELQKKQEQETSAGETTPAALDGSPGARDIKRIDNSNAPVKDMSEEEILDGVGDLHIPGT